MTAEPATPEPVPVPVPVAAPVQLVSLQDVHAVLAERHGWPLTHVPRRHGDPVLPILPAQQEAYVRARAESIGLSVVEGWQGKPALTQADAERLLAAQRQADDEQAEREARDSAASTEFVHEPDELRVSEMLQFFGASRISQACRPGGYGLPGPITDQAKFQAEHAPELVALAASQGSLSATVAGPTRDDDDGW